MHRLVQSGGTVGSPLGLFSLQPLESFSLRCVSDMLQPVSTVIYFHVRKCSGSNALWIDRTAQFWSGTRVVYCQEGSSVAALTVQLAVQLHAERASVCYRLVTRLCRQVPWQCGPTLFYSQHYLARKIQLQAVICLYRSSHKSHSMSIFSRLTSRVKAKEHALNAGNQMHQGITATCHLASTSGRMHCAHASRGRQPAGRTQAVGADAPYIYVPDQRSHSLSAKGVDVIRSMDSWAGANLPRYLKNAEDNWQPQDWLPEPSSPDFYDQVTLRLQPFPLCALLAIAHHCCIDQTCHLLKDGSLVVAFKCQLMYLLRAIRRGTFNIKVIAIACVYLGPILLGGSGWQPRSLAPYREGACQDFQSVHGVLVLRSSGLFLAPANRLVPQILHSSYCLKY